MPSPPAWTRRSPQSAPSHRFAMGMKAALQKELAALFWGAAAVKADGSVRHCLSEGHAFIPEKQELGWMWLIAFLRSPPPWTGSWFAL